MTTRCLATGYKIFALKQSIKRRAEVKDRGLETEVGRANVNGI